MFGILTTDKNDYVGLTCYKRKGTSKTIPCRPPPVNEPSYTPTVSVDVLNGKGSANWLWFTWGVVLFL